MSNLVTISDLDRMANAVAKSGLFGIKTPEQAMALMLIAQAEGLHPAIAARDYHVIQGRPSLKADAMMARFQAAGGKVRWEEYTDARVVGFFSHPSGGEVKIEWTIEKAKSLGFLSKDNWKNYPRAMMRARCISEGIRTVFPGCVVGVYTPEEVEDFDAPRPIRDMGPAEVVQPVVRGMEEGSVVDYISAIEAAATMEDLESVYKKAYVAAHKLHDTAAINRLIAAKDARKANLQPSDKVA